MIASEIRANARRSLEGKWGKAALMTLAYGVIVFVINFVLGLIPVIGSIVSFVISTPISYGLIVAFMKLKRGEEVGYVDFLNYGFSDFGRVWGVVGNILLKLILPICLVVICIIVITFGMAGSLSAGIYGAAYRSTYSASSSFASGLAGGLGVLAIIGIIGYLASLIYLVVKSYYYTLSFYILNDNPNMTGREIVEESRKLMTGHRWHYFGLGLTFIGWLILSAFTLYIGLLWLMPYVMVATICFYEQLAGKSTQTVETEVVSNNQEKNEE